MDILSLLKGMDKDTLEKGIKQAQEFLSTPEGKNAAKMLSEGKMPDGVNISEDLTSLAQSISEDKKAQKMLGELIKRQK